MVRCSPLDGVSLVAHTSPASESPANATPSARQQERPRLRQARCRGREYRRRPPNRPRCRRPFSSWWPRGSPGSARPAHRFRSHAPRAALQLERSKTSRSSMISRSRSVSAAEASRRPLGLGRARHRRELPWSAACSSAREMGCRTFLEPTLEVPDTSFSAIGSSLFAVGDSPTRVSSERDEQRSDRDTDQCGQYQEDADLGRRR